MATVSTDDWTITVHEARPSRHIPLAGESGISEAPPRPLERLGLAKHRGAERSWERVVLLAGTAPARGIRGQIGPLDLLFFTRAGESGIRRTASPT